ncbi:hypothetical protein FACS189435_3170 [Bacteroidia bacterium]|nr:hypothetical protein FACS189435_3170 [Bacteroidia bacterium]
MDLLPEAREAPERPIGKLHVRGLHARKPRTCRKLARKACLSTAREKDKSKKAIRKAAGKQSGYLKRNPKPIHRLLDACPVLPLEKRERKYSYAAEVLYARRREMCGKRIHSMAGRVASIRQPHVRPIARGKSQAEVEFGSKAHASVIDGISFLDELSRDAFNEGSRLEAYVEKYRERFGCYPREVLAGQIYCTRPNRAMPKGKGTRLLANPLGRPPAMPIHASPGKRNPVEGKSGQAKTAYGLNRIKARPRQTGESWIAGIFLVLNPVKLAGAALPCLVLKRWLGFSAMLPRELFDTKQWKIFFLIPKAHYL